MQDVFSGKKKSKYRKHNFAFAGLLTCVHDGCSVTTELQKRKYINNRCSHGRGKCSLPYMRESDVSDRLGALLKGIEVPETVAAAIVASLRSELENADTERRQKVAETHQALAAVRTRMDRIYENKLDGKIDDDFWTRKMSEYRD